VPTPVSVTQTPCTCGYLERAAQSAIAPIKFDEALNEYTFEDKTSNSSIAIYHCPWCGGVASASKRDALFASVSPKEAARVGALVRHLDTTQAIESALGKPDKTFTHHREPQEIAMFQRMASSPVHQWSFTRLSRTANIEFSIYPDGKIECVIVPKQKRQRGTR
jgi:hypothetical protein